MCVGVGNLIEQRCFCHILSQGENLFGYDVLQLSDMVLVCKHKQFQKRHVHRMWWRRRYPKITSVQPFREILKSCNIIFWKAYGSFRAFLEVGGECSFKEGRGFEQLFFVKMKWCFALTDDQGDSGYSAPSTYCQQSSLHLDNRIAYSILPLHWYLGSHQMGHFLIF